MKAISSLVALLFCAFVATAQTYPEPEFSNEVYYLKKENPYSLVRLEKSQAKQENKVNVIKGSEYGYVIDGKSSPVRFASGNNVSFIFSNGSSQTSTAG